MFIIVQSISPENILFPDLRFSRGNIEPIYRYSRPVLENEIQLTLGLANSLPQQREAADKC